MYCNTLKYVLLLFIININLTYCAYYESEPRPVFRHARGHERAISAPFHHQRHHHIPPTPPPKHISQHNQHNSPNHEYQHNYHNEIKLRHNRFSKFDNLLNKLNDLNKPKTRERASPYTKPISYTNSKMDLTYNMKPLETKGLDTYSKYSSKLSPYLQHHRHEKNIFHEEKSRAKLITAKSVTKTNLDEDDDYEYETEESLFGEHNEKDTMKMKQANSETTTRIPEVTTTEPLDYGDDDEDYEEDKEVDESSGFQHDEHESKLGGHSASSGTLGGVGGTLTEQKWKHFGTRHDVEVSRREYYRPRGTDGNASDTKRPLAQDHLNRMQRVLSCRRPAPRVVQVQAVHPDSSKNYMPHCTILHRCGDDVGCCNAATLVCAAKRTQAVEMYFFTRSIGDNTSKVEKLIFTNHTECHCVEKRDQYSLQKSSVESADSMLEDQSLEGAHNAFHIPSYRTGVTLGYDVNARTVAPEPLRRCRCPNQFSAHLLDDGSCQCECFDGQKDCGRLKRGKEYFGYKDRVCIQKGQCLVPQCEFGAYVRKSGRCPRKQEKFEASGKMFD